MPKAAKSIIFWCIAALLVIAAVGPFVWLLATALKPQGDNIFDTAALWPAHPTLENFAEVWQKVPLGQYLINSVAVSILAIGLNLAISVLAGYPLARMRFTGKPIVFGIVLASMMIPFQVILIPLYQLMLKLGLTDYTGGQSLFSPFNIWVGLAIPVAVSGFGMLFIRQSLAGLPKALEEAALLDGCTPLQTLWYIILPLIQPALATLAIFTLMASWGEFLWPSITVSQPQHYTLPVGLVALQSAFSSNWRVVAAGTIISMVPMLVLFLLFQRFFIRGLNDGGVKG